MSNRRTPWDPESDLIDLGWIMGSHVERLSFMFVSGSLFSTICWKTRIWHEKCGKLQFS